MKIKRKPLSVAVAGLAAGTLLSASVGNAQGVHEAEPIFTIDDLQVDFAGTTFGPNGLSSDQSAICGLDPAVYPGSPNCPQDGDDDLEWALHVFSHSASCLSISNLLNPCSLHASIPTASPARENRKTTLSSAKK